MRRSPPRTPSPPAPCTTSRGASGSAGAPPAAPRRCPRSRRWSARTSLNGRPRPLGRHHRPGMRRHRVPPSDPRPEGPGPHRRRSAGPPRSAPHRRHRSPPPGPTVGHRGDPPDRPAHRPLHRPGCPRCRDHPARLRLGDAALRAGRAHRGRRRVQARRHPAHHPRSKTDQVRRRSGRGRRPRPARRHRPDRRTRRLARPPRTRSRPTLHEHAQSDRHPRADLRRGHLDRASQARRGRWAGRRTHHGRTRCAPGTPPPPPSPGSHWTGSPPRPGTSGCPRCWSATSDPPRPWSTPPAATSDCETAEPPPPGRRECSSGQFPQSPPRSCSDGVRMFGRRRSDVQDSRTSCSRCRSGAVSDPRSARACAVLDAGSAA